MRKLLLGIVGTSTAGKSTLASALLTKASSPIVTPLPQTTSRAPRPDDDSRFVRCLPSGEFSNVTFESCFGEYGLASDDIRSFISDLQTEIGVTILSSLDVCYLKSSAAYRNCGYDLKVVMITHSKSLEVELNTIATTIPGTRSDPKVAERLIAQREICAKYFFDPNFNNRCVDLWLTRQEHRLEQMVDLVDKYVAPGLIQDHRALSGLVASILDRPGREIRITNQMPR